MKQISTIKYMLVHILAFACLGMSSTLPVIAQCGKPLVERAVAEIGTDAMYMRHFEVTFSKASLKRPEKVAKFNTLLTGGNTYRFNVQNSDIHPGKAVLQLRYKGNIVGSTMNESGDLQECFDYECKNNGYHQVLISFNNGEPGCAVGVQSNVLTAEKIKKDTNETSLEVLEVLYMGVENPLNIAATGVPEGSLEVNIDQGRIIKKEGRYRAVVNQPGKATIKVVAKDKSGAVKEIGTADFRVEELPLPQISVNGVGGGLISKELFLRTERIELFYPVNMEGLSYEIIGFSIRPFNSFESIATNGNRLSDPQERLIEQLNQGSRIIIHDVILEDMHGNRINIEPAEFILN